MTAAGYNSAWSFKTVTEEKLSEAEDFIEKHHRLEADGFEEYKDIKPFKFLPGHKSLIFGIKTEIDEYQDMKKPKISKKSIPVLSENDLQMSLLSQMSTFSKKLGLHADWSNSIENSSYSASETAVLFAALNVLFDTINIGRTATFANMFVNMWNQKCMRQQTLLPMEMPTFRIENA